MDPKRVALVHDWLTGMRGGEKVLEGLCEIFPGAPIYTLFHFKGTVSSIIESHPIYTSWLNGFPFLKKKYRYYLPLFPCAIESFDLKGFDLVISTSHCVAKGVRTPPDSLHIAYLHTPMRYVWDMYEDYFASQTKPMRILIGLISNYLRIWDVTSSSRVDIFLANSNHVAKRIQKYYRRDSWVIYPPVSIEEIPVGPEKREDFFLIVSALVPYKKIDMAIKVFNEIGEPLKIAGSGPQEKYLRKIAKGNIEFLGWLPWNRLAKLYTKAKALIFPGEEDFGIVPVEAQAAGCPIIAYAKGGILETVIPINPRDNNETDSIAEPTGVFFYEQNQASLKQAIDTFIHVQEVFKPQKIRQNAERFSKARFIEEIQSIVAQY